MNNHGKGTVTEREQEIQIDEEIVENSPHGQQAQQAVWGSGVHMGASCGEWWGHLPPFDSKLGIPCMMTWWRKSGLLFILMLPERSPLK